MRTVDESGAVRYVAPKRVVRRPNGSELWLYGDRKSCRQCKRDLPDDEDHFVITGRHVREGVHTTTDICKVCHGLSLTAASVRRRLTRLTTRYEALRTVEQGFGRRLSPVGVSIAKVGLQHLELRTSHIGWSQDGPLSEEDRDLLASVWLGALNDLEAELPGSLERVAAYWRGR